MSLLAVLLQDESFKFSEDHLDEIKNMLTPNSRKENSQFYHERLFALATEGVQLHTFSKGRYTLVIDGVITNIAELYEKLKEAGVTLQNSSDTEIIAQLFIENKTDFTQKIDGAFVFLLWDNEEKTLIGGVDPFGKYQLYFRESAEELIFATEKNSMYFSHYEEQLDDFAFHHYFDYKYIPEPHTFTQGIKRIPKGHFFIKEQNNPIQFFPYYDFPRSEDSGVEGTLVKGKEIFRETVHFQLALNENNGLIVRDDLADLALAHIAKQYDENLTLFSASHEENNPFARQVAEELSLEHIHVTITPQALMEELPKIMSLLEDPFTQPDIVTNYFIAKEAEGRVDSLLSSLGAEPGLGNYVEGKNILSRVGKLLRKSKETKEHFLPLFSDSMKRKLFTRFGSVDPDVLRFYEEVKGLDQRTRRQFIELNSSFPNIALQPIRKVIESQGLTLHTPFISKKLLEVVHSLPTEQRARNELSLSIVSERFSVQKVRRLTRDKVAEIPYDKWLRIDCFDWAIEFIKGSEIDDYLSKEEVLKLFYSFKEKKNVDFQIVWSILMFVLWHVVFVEKDFLNTLK